MNEITVQASVENIQKVTEWVDEQLELLNCSLKAQMQIDVAIDEVFGNIAHYAYPEGVGTAVIRFEPDPETGMVTLTFLDRGIPFNPLEKTDPDILAGPEERAVGGLGIFLVKKTMDDVSYQSVDGQNILSLKKKI